MMRSGMLLALTAMGGLTMACGSSKDDGSGAMPDPLGTNAAIMKTPSGAISTDGVEAKALTSSKTDWTNIETSKDEPAPADSGDAKPTKPTKPTKADLSKIATDGIVAAPISGFAAVKATGFRVAYAPTQKYDHFKNAFQQEKLFENVALMLNQTIKMPRVVDIHLVECGTVNAFYDPSNNRIIMCYELMDYYTKMFKPVSKTNEELGNSIVGATFFAFFHELGHGLIHQLDLATTGREEDAVDQMATLILMEGGDQGVAWAMAGANWFALQSAANKKSGNNMPFWDEHSLEGQRFYNIACLVFGSAPEKYKPMVKNDFLPAARARRCPSEYRRIAKSWERLLTPHFKKEDGLAKKTAEQPSKVPATPAEVPQQPTTADEPEWGDTAKTPAQPPATPANDPMAPKPLPGTGGGNQPTSGGISCEKVVDHALGVVVKELLAQAQKQGPEAVAKMQQELQSNGPLIRQAGIQECQDENWTQKQRTCAMKGSTMAKLKACGLD